jgi:hypothetical protein
MLHRYPPNYLSLVCSVSMPPKLKDPPKGSTSTPTPATRKIRTSAARWSNEEMTSMASQLVQAKIDSETSENGFKKNVWNKIAASFEDPLKKNYLVCDTKFSRMKKEYKEVRKLHKETSEFGWDVKG